MSLAVNPPPQILKGPGESPPQPMRRVPRRRHLRAQLLFNRQHFLSDLRVRFASLAQLVNSVKTAFTEALRLQIGFGVVLCEKSHGFQKADLADRVNLGLLRGMLAEAAQRF